MTLIRSEGSGDADLGFYNDVATRSARFRQADSSYLSKTFSSDGDLRQMTFSFWIKRGQIVMGSYNVGEIITQGYSGAGGTQSSARITLESDKLNIAQENNNATTWERISNRLFRDLSAWYHFVIAFDVTESSSSDRVKAWVNGVAITWATETSSKPDQNTDMLFGKAAQRIGVGDGSGNPWSASYFDGYMSNFEYCDGEVKAATDFGEFKYGAWIPKEYEGSYGTNGFRLEFKQTGTGTAGDSTIGADTANNNDWTTNNFASHDSNLLDCPENNFCTLNPLNANDHRGEATISEGNLRIVSTSGNRGFTTGTMKIHGKVYFEVLSKDGNNGFVGIADIENALNGSNGQSIDMYNGTPRTDGSAHSNTGTYDDGDIVGVAVDVDAKSVEFFNNNSSVYSDNYTTAAEYFPFIHDSSGGRSMDAIANFGQDSSFAGETTAQGNTDGNGKGDFYYSPPSGYLALCSANFDEPTIGPNSATQADDHFEPTLYTSDNIGAGGTQNVTNVNFQPDIVWLKNRDSSSTEHTVYDSAVTYGGNSYHWATDSQSNRVGANSQYGYLSAFNSNGFTLTGGSTNANYVNQGTDKYVAYNWKAGGATSADNSAGEGATPTSGSVKIDGSNLGSALAGDIPATRLTANTTAGISIITYSGNQTSDETIAHGLGAVPEFIIVKVLTGTYNTYGSIYHVKTGTGKELYLPLTQAASSSDFWITTPTTTVFSVSDSDYVNYNNYTYVAYAFAPVEGFSKFGKYTGNGNADGAFIYTGFSPSWIMTRSESTGNWYINDTARSPGNPTSSFGANLYADSSGVESGNGMDILSNGFKIRNTDASQNTNTQSYIYMAFAEMPFKYALAK